MTGFEVWYDVISFIQQEGIKVLALESWNKCMPIYYRQLRIFDIKKQL